MLRPLFVIVFAAAVVMGSEGQGERPASPKATLLPVLTILDDAKLSGSLEISGRCDLQFLPDLPAVRANANNGASLLLELREAFANDSAMQITQEPGGMIRMNEIGVPTDILSTRISHILFEDYAHNAVYNPNDALRVILKAPEVAALMKARNIVDPNAMGAVRGNVGHWPVEWPHISGTLDNITLSEALDYVLKTFPGIWLYENCPQTDKRNRVAYFRFFYIRRMGTMAPFVEE